MASYRHDVDIEGVGAEYLTLKADSSLTTAYGSGGVAAVEGKFVALTGDLTVGFGADTNPLYGKIMKYERDGLVSVQVGGYTWGPGVSGALAAAGSNLAVNGAGLVKVAGAGVYSRPKSVGVDATNVLVAVDFG
jgi:hypothetical protein